jgi:hypothetical protein
MDIFFADPSEIPLPPGEVRIRELKVEPWPDGTRLRVYLEVDPFQKRPNADLTVLDQAGRELSNVSVIESMTRKMELVMHLRGASQGSLTLQALLYYASLPEAAEPGGASGGSPGPDPRVERSVIDSRQVTFELPI